MLSGIRLVTFDVLHTIITPRLPIYVQYSQVFEPYLGVLPPDAIRASFKSALRDVQKEHPSYRQGVEAWWRDVIRRTALGAGGNERALDANLTPIVDSLMKRFSSREGYAAFDDAIPTIKQLNTMGIRTAVVSNGDSRLRSVLHDLDFPHIQDSIMLSAEEGIEKPSQAIFMKALELVNCNEREPIRPSECLHVGDELECDYHGATAAGFNALLIRRPGPLGKEEHKETDNEGEAGRQIALSFNDWLTLPISPPHRTGVLAISTHLHPQFHDQPQLGYVIARDFLGGEWDVDILSQRGFDKMKELWGISLAAPGRSNPL